MIPRDGLNPGCLEWPDLERFEVIAKEVEAAGGSNAIVVIMV